MATSFDSYRPFDAGAGANVDEASWRQMARLWCPDGPLIAGQTVTALEPYADSSGMQIKVRAGEVWIRGHHGTKAAETILPIATNTSGSARTDLVVARADFVNNTVELDIVTGTPGGGIPAFTQDATRWEVVLAWVAVANNASTIAAGNITDLRELVGHATGTYQGNAFSAVPVQGSGASAGYARWERMHRRVKVSGYALWSAAGMSFGVAGGFALPFPAYVGPPPGVGPTPGVGQSPVTDIGTYLLRTSGGVASIGVVGAVSTTQGRASLGTSSLATGDSISWQLDYIAAR